MNTDVPSGLSPIDKTQPSADIKSSHLQFKIRGEEGDERNDIIAASDRVQFSQKTESTQSEMMHQLTTDKNLNEYINMLKQAAELEDSAFNDSSLKQQSRKETLQPSQKPDFMA